MKKDQWFSNNLILRLEIFIECGFCGAPGGPYNLQHMGYKMPLIANTGEKNLKPELNLVGDCPSA
jgi:hypothetical protein